MERRWTVNLDPDEPCPAEKGWADFWDDPPTLLADPLMATYREWVEEVFRDPDFGEDICPHCLANARRVRVMVEALEEAARASDYPDGAEGRSSVTDR